MRRNNATAPPQNLPPSTGRRATIEPIASLPTTAMVVSRCPPLQATHHRHGSDTTKTGPFACLDQGPSWACMVGGCFPHPGFVDSLLDVVSGGYSVADACPLAALCDPGLQHLAVGDARRLSMQDTANKTPTTRRRRLPCPASNPSTMPRPTQAAGPKPPRPHRDKAPPCRAPAGSRLDRHPHKRACVPLFLRPPRTTIRFELGNDCRLHPRKLAIVSSCCLLLRASNRMHCEISLAMLGRVPLWTSKWPTLPREDTHM